MILCIEVKLREVKSISPLAVKALDYSGGTAILPKSMIYHNGGNSYWVASFILKQKELAYSYKNEMMVDLVTGYCKPRITITEKIPEKIEFDGIKDVDELKR